MSAATMTLIGLYNYDDTIFDNLTVPESLDKDTLVNNILLRSGDFECLYTRPDFIKFAIGVWSNKWQATMEKWSEALAIDYEPLQNYDRNESWSDTKTGTQTDVQTGDQTNVRSGDQTNVRSGNQTNTRSGDQTNVKTGNIKEQSDGGNTNTNEVSAFDGGSSYTPHDKQTFDTDQSNTTTYNSVQDKLTFNNFEEKLTFNNVQDKLTFNSVQEKLTFNSVQNQRTDNLSDGHTGRVYGNIGVTTSQQMLEAELKVRAWNIYEHITDLFLTEFVLPIY